MATEINIIEINDKPFAVVEDTLYPLVDYIKENGNLKAKKTRAKTRTITQNAAMHKYCALVAEAFNDGGFSMQKIMEHIKKIEIEWSMDAVKEVIWRGFQRALVNKESTTELETHEVSKVYKYIDFWLSDTVGMESIAFPSKESLIFEQNYKRG